MQVLVSALRHACMHACVCVCVCVCVCTRERETVTDFLCCCAPQTLPVTAIQSAVRPTVSTLQSAWTAGADVSGEVRTHDAVLVWHAVCCTCVNTSFLVCFLFGLHLVWLYVFFLVCRPRQQRFFTGDYSVFLTETEADVYAANGVPTDLATNTTYGIGYQNEIGWANDCRASRQDLIDMSPSLDKLSLMLTLTLVRNSFPTRVAVVHVSSHTTAAPRSFSPFPSNHSLSHTRVLAHPSACCRGAGSS